MSGVVRKARELQVEEAQDHLRRGNLAPERRRPTRCDSSHVAAGIAISGASLGDHVGHVLQEHFSWSWSCALPVYFSNGGAQWIFRAGR